MFRALLLQALLGVWTAEGIRAKMLAAAPAADAAAPAAAAPAAAPAQEASENKTETQATALCQFEIENLDYASIVDHEGANTGLRNATMDFIQQAAMDSLAAGGPAAAPAPAAALPQLRSSAGPAAAPAASPAAAAAPAAAAPVQTFVTLTEGAGDSVQVNAWAVPADASAVPKVTEKLKDVCKKDLLAKALLNASGVKWAHLPMVVATHAHNQTIQLFKMDCAPHIEKIVTRFSHSYTRRMVPDALDAACHLFESKVSFSGNHRINKWDKHACHLATQKLMHQWQGGNGKKDYDTWCHDICELKLGRGAPQCHL